MNKYLDSICNHSFETLLSTNVYWVPFNYLSKGEYTIEQIKEINLLSPYKKQETIHTLYDSINLFINSKFEEENDNKLVCFDNLTWEFYKSGYLSVLSNNGCCSSCCSWLNFILNKAYIDIGTIGIIRSISGHAINYIYHDNWYYIIDMNLFMKKYISDICPQTGLKSDLIKSKFLTGILVKAKTLEEYVNFYMRYMSCTKSQILFIQHKSNKITPIARDLINIDNKTVYLPKNENIKVIYHKKSLPYKYIDFPNINNPYN